jgi:exopolysaccharide biosynthesis polyprenyl glycosylphosphotransferase
MRNNTSIVYNIWLLVGDSLMIIFGLSLAYILRVSINHHPFSEHVYAITYLGFLFLLLPFWLIVFAILGLYSERYYQNRFSELGRVVVGSFIGILFAISYSYMLNVHIFPARLVVVYGFILSVITVLIFRNMARFIQRSLFRKKIGINKVLIIGDNRTASILINGLSNTKITGYQVIGIVGEKGIPILGLKKIKLFTNFESATKELSRDQFHTIIQTELYASSAKNDQILNYAQTNHIAYRFVPGNSDLFIGNITVDLFNSIPVIAVHQTALVGWGRVAKRTMDILLGTILMIIAIPFMILIAIIQKLNDPFGPIFYSADRLSRFGETVKIYKFRSIKPAYSNMTPEEGFKKMGRLDLIKIYRENGDQLQNDPRISSWGNFLRRSSLDELPQILNVIKGDISLVGPRALDKFELDQYDKKSLILSVKSGLTGLAQISGRRDISFKERRKLDLYYVQNWTFLGDLIILAKTAWVVLFHKGAN